MNTARHSPAYRLLGPQVRALETPDSARRMEHAHYRGITALCGYSLISAMISMPTLSARSLIASMSLLRIFRIKFVGPSTFEI